MGEFQFLKDGGNDTILTFRFLPTGVMAFDMASIDGGINWRPAALIKTTEEMRRDFGSNPHISLRGAAFALNDVYLFTQMVKVGRNSYFESWLNYHADGGIGKSIFEGLASHLYITVIFLDEETSIVSAHEVKNSLRYGFKDYQKSLANVKPWTMGEFDGAKEDALNILPSLPEMWGMFPKPPSLRIGLEVNLGK